MMIDPEIAVQIVMVVFTIIGAVWKLSSQISKTHRETMSEINALKVALAKIESDTQHAREDHDLVVRVVTVLEKTQKDVQAQWDRIKETEKDVSAWGAELHKLRR